MGGNSSGRPRDPKAKPTVGAYSGWALDVRVMGRDLARPGTIFEYHWHRQGKPTGSIVCAVYPNVLQLAYQVSQDNGAWEGVKETVRLETTPCHYGGQRYWFRCPKCNRRTVIIYILERPFRCRVCLGLAYYSQRRQAVDRALDRWQTLLRRLGGSGSIANDSPPRPQGMQRRVYERLREEAEEARVHFWGTLAERFHFSASSDREEDDEDWEEAEEDED